MKHTCSPGCGSNVWQSWINDCIVFKGSPCQHKCNRAPSPLYPWLEERNEKPLWTRWLFLLNEIGVLSLVFSIKLSLLFVYCRRYIWCILPHFVLCTEVWRSNKYEEIKRRKEKKKNKLWEWWKEGRENQPGIFNISNSWAAVLRSDTSIQHWPPK